MTEMTETTQIPETGTTEAAGTMDMTRIPAMCAVEVQEIDHVEFWVADARGRAADLVAGFGFRLGEATGQVAGHSVWVTQGTIRLRLVSPAEPGDQVAEFVRRHGDGVAVIALRVDDAAAAHAAALESGGTPVILPEAPGATGPAPAIAGFCDVALSFHDAPPPAGADSADLLCEIDHVAICVPIGELKQSAGFCEQVLGMQQIFTEYINVGSQGMDSTVMQSRSGGVTFTFLQPDGSRDPGQIDGFLAANDGAGVQHLAYRTDDIALAVRTCEQQGTEFLTTPSEYYDAIEARVGTTGIALDRLRELNVLVDRDHGGQLFQIFSRSVHPRGTYFSELIERRGANTFGTANITALYEAIARRQSVPSS